MRTIEECGRALTRLSENLARADGDLRRAAALDRSLSCRITDLDVTFVGRLAEGHIRNVTSVPGPPPERAQIRLTMASDDLIALVDGELNFAKAWGSGRVKLEAALLDLLRLRSLL
ncbi:SCP2 sterol-binding domain-containing protein [Streptomyces sp. KR80]|uniref:SCP2 sterol-binding domain-containing protein n=1 Tax=Streptomyces sp. KR80 TaxID=3457426 RepID=UPI003FD50753